MSERFGDSTRSVRAVDSDPVPGQPIGGIPVPASTFHLSADEGTEPHVYGRYSNPTWTLLEGALAQLEGAASALVFGSGMAAVTAALRVLVAPGTVLLIPSDGYYQVRRWARESLAPMGVLVRAAVMVCDTLDETLDLVMVDHPVRQHIRFGCGDSADHGLDLVLGERGVAQ